MHINPKTTKQIIKGKSFKVLVFIIECNIYKRNKEQSLQLQGKIM